MQRKLVAIMVADFVGSTAAMESHEEEAVECVSACLRAVGDTVVRHDGRVFNTAGDAVLAEFGSPVNALRAAMEARSSLATIPDATPNHMRFGLHLADVFAVGDDLKGNGVNLAARLQSEAAAGAIEVSEALYQQVRRASPCAFEEIGERRFKGVTDPIRVYRVGTNIDRHRFLSAPTREAPPAAMRPNSVIVTPFVAFAASPDEQSFLTEGLTDDLTLELGRLKSLFVSSRSASVALSTRDPVEVGRALGVRYVVSGSVRKLAGAVRLNVSLSETANGHLVWSDRIERPFEELLAVIDEVTARIAATVAGRIEQAELVAARLKRPDNMSAYEYYLLGLDHHRLIGVADRHIGEAMRWFERSMDADPSFGRPVAMHVCAWSNLPDFDLSAGERQVAHALDLDPTDPDSHRIMGAIKCMEGDFVASRHHHERAIELAPNDAYIAGRCAAFYTYANEAERALELLDRAEALDPFLPVWIVEERVASLYMLGRHDELFAVARALPYQTRRTLIYRIAARMARGDTERARQLVAQAKALDPKLSAGYIRTQEFFRDRTVTDALVNTVHAAGLPLA